MSNLQPFNPPPPPLPLPMPRTGRILSRLSADTTVAVAVTQAKAEIEAAKVDGISSVAAKALHDVALLSQVEQSLATTVPHASGRLATVADIAAVSVAGVVADAARRMGR